MIRSKTATMITVESSRVKFAPANTPAMSTWKPSGPVMYTSRPAGMSSLAIARISAMRSLRSAFSSISAKGTVMTATVPSSETCAGGTNASPSSSPEVKSRNLSPAPSTKP